MIYFALWCVFLWVIFCAIRAWRKQDQLLDVIHWKIPPWWEHVFLLVSFRSPKRLYDPVLQMAWDPPNRPLILDSRWWRIYHELYEILPTKDQEAIREIMARKDGYPPGLEQAIYIYTHMDIDAFLGVLKYTPNNMSDGAAEYEEIMSYMEAMRPN